MLIGYVLSHYLFIQQAAAAILQDSILWTGGASSRHNLVGHAYVLKKNIHPDSVLALNGAFLPALTGNEEKFIGGNWLRFRIHNSYHESESVVLQVKSSYIQFAQLYVQTPAGLKSLGITGDYVPQSQRPMKGHSMIFPIKLQAAASGTYYLYARSPLSFKAPLALYAAESYSRKNYVDNLLYGFYYGLLFFVLLMTAFLVAIFPGERIYLYYLFYVLAVIVFYLDINGLGNEFFWPDWPLIVENIGDVSGILSVVFLLLYTVQFLQVDKQFKSLRKFYSFFLWVFIALLILSFIHNENIFPRKALVSLLFLSILVFSALSLYTAALALRRGFRPALFYLVAYSFSLLGFLVSLFSIYFTGDRFTMHAIQGGNLAEVFILTLGLAYWFKKTYDEKQTLLVRVNEHQREMTNEKDRIARDLHDNIGTQLTTLSLGLSRLSRNRTQQPSKIQSLYELTNSTILELRDTIWVITKNEISLDELADKIENLIWRFRRNSEGTTFALKAEELPAKLALQPTQAINLFRIVQEALGNCIKHSKARSITITLSGNDSEICLSVSDNGVGFEQTGQDMPEHYGLINMQKRAEQLGGKFRLDSQPGQGTSVEVRLKI